MSTLVTSTTPRARRIGSHLHWVSRVIAPAMCALCLILGGAVGMWSPDSLARSGSTSASLSSRPVHIVHQYGLVLQCGASPNSDVDGGPGTI